ncbi:NADPH-dependent FMN reductase [Arthrobacter sp. 9V]|uniref:flavodoxin family protein n=1 Tax=Arthrobacter sp. 9V TaxID=2653132 RepID=UPI0012EEFC7D|nr:NAD(P)H-dependent oxidoreductase [Arthrobacter sp. 9V]VXC48343.1 NADPH-dependent FMN reductase [Arthrobacter sp. 9V]
MRALVLNCTLKSSPTPSNTDVLANVVIEALREKGVDVEVIRAVDHRIPPGVETDLGEGDEWPKIYDLLMASWTYWNMGPGPGPSYTETDHGHEWSESTGKTMAANLFAAATALQANPLPPAG